jgi:hypothetical protein
MADQELSRVNTVITALFRPAKVEREKRVLSHAAFSAKKVARQARAFAKRGFAF